MSDSRSTLEVPDSPVAFVADRRAVTVLVCVFVIALCGLVYELIAGTLASYLLGDSVTQFSLTIGIFLTAMGVGSWLSRYVGKRLAVALVIAEILVGIIGGLTALAGFVSFAYTGFAPVVLAGCVFAVGALVGLEIPLVLRILEERRSLRVTVANVFTVDYVGALAASLLFPFLLLPWLGLVRAGFVAGLTNVIVAGLLLRALRDQVGPARRGLASLVLVSTLFLTAGAVASGRLVSWVENQIYQDEIIYAVDTPYQRLVVTRWRDDVRLFLDGHLQFSSVDEYRYHETLAHPALSLADRRDRVLILGGGDGLLAREILRYPEVTRVDLVDLDPEVTRLFRENPTLAALNEGAHSDDRVRIHSADALRYLEDTDEIYDVILMDLPDPNRDSLAKLYSRAFFRLALRRLAAGGIVATQATSPYRARHAFWCIANTMDATSLGPEEEQDTRSAGDTRDSDDSRDTSGRGAPRRLHAYPYHTVLPTFGTWGFVVASDRPRDVKDLQLEVPMRYLSKEILDGLFRFPTDMARVETELNELSTPVLGDYYRRGYHRYLE
jgi:spermidine synthase